ncbi:MAG: 50S ribosomal protein L25 [Chloroflexota bacterium]|nr:50S ribosomal protein L25 [Chloroflexota bacterium]MDE2696927.1 50S ribosomal protein L25 [Chloroflexota bacterium]
MPDRYSVTTRSVLGKSTKHLRWDGILPANVYGRGLESVAVQLPYRGAEAILAEHGLNSLIELEIEGESEERPVVIRSVQRHPLTRELQHFDFYQVDLTREMQAMVPVTLTGEAPAVHTYQGVVITGSDRISVQALPADIPSHLELSIDGLEEIDQQLTVADLDLPGGVTVLTEPEIMLARVQPPRKIEDAVEEAELLEGEEGELAEGEEGEEGAAEDSSDGADD